MDLQILKGCLAQAALTHTNQALEIGSLKRKVKKLEKKASKRTHKLSRLYKIGSSRRIESSDEASFGDQEDAFKQGRIIDNLDADKGVTLVDEAQGRNDQDMFDTGVLDDEEVVAKKEVSTAAPVSTVGEVVTTVGVEFLIIHQPPQETNLEILQARENLMEAIHAFLTEYDHIPPREKCMALLVAEERKPPIFFVDDDDDDEESSIPLRDIISELPLSIAIAPNFPITDSLIMKDGHLDTILETETDEESESSVEDLNLTPSESGDLSDIESECDMPVCDDFMTFSNLLFDSYDGSTSSDDDSFYDEDVLKENFKIYSNPLFDEESVSTKIDPHHFNAESDFIESLLSQDTLGMFFFLTLLNDDSISLPKNESFHFNHYYDPSSPRLPAKPPDDDGIHFDAEPDTRILTVKVVDDISERYVLKPRILPTRPTLSLCPVIDTLLLFSFENEDKVFNLGIHASKEEKSPHLLSHRGFKAF
uniref:Uncharacterized protein n=1 Tax=Tanacetum cinerariifolium TaxID=118510 RepID=A0A6L2LEL3_TANCI|nr:hypothetical protein [Tanacetum cinerariifolium]